MRDPAQAFRSFMPDIEFEVGMKLRHRHHRDVPPVVVVAVGVNVVTLRHMLTSGETYEAEAYKMAVSANYEPMAPAVKHD